MSQIWPDLLAIITRKKTSRYTPSPSPTPLLNPLTIFELLRKQIDIINCDVGKYQSQSAHECLSPLTLTHLLRGATL